MLSSQKEIRGALIIIEHVIKITRDIETVKLSLLYQYIIINILFV